LKEKEKEKEKFGKQDREERVLIIDVNDSGDGITSASSLSSNWQILSASLTSAPTWDGADPSSDNNDQEGNRDRGLMLRVEGVGVEKEEETEGLGIAAGKSTVLGEEEMQSLLEGFDRKMGVLMKIVAAGTGVGEKEPAEEKEEAKEV
jgi:hypothetical protein